MQNPCSRHNWVKKWIIIWICLNFCFLLRGQRFAQIPVSLSKAIEDGLATNYLIQIADVELDQARLARKQGPAERFPSIGFSLNQSNRLSRDNSPVSFTDGTYTKNELSGSIDTDWLLFGGHRVRIDKERLEELERQKQGQGRLAVENSIKEIILAYYRALIEREKLQLAEEARSFSQDKMRKAAMEYEVERISRFDLNNFRNELLTDSIKYNTQEKRYNQSLIRLKSLMGYNENDNITLTDPLPTENKIYLYEDLLYEMLSNNAQLQNENIAIRLQENTVQQQIARRKPTVRLRNSISEEINTSKFNEDDRENGGILDIYASLSLSYNIFDGGKQKQLIQRSKMNRIIADKRYEDLKRRLKQELQVNLEEYNRQVEILEMNKSLSENLTENLVIAEDRLENGYSIFVEFRDAKLELAKSQQEVLQTIYEMKIAEVEIIRLIGGLLN